MIDDNQSRILMVDAHIDEEIFALITQTLRRNKLKLFMSWISY